MARLYDAVKAANPDVQVIGASTVQIDAGNLAFQAAAISASGGKVDGVSFHPYNAIVGDYADGKISLDILAAWRNANGLTGRPLWQTEQGEDFAYHGTAYMRYSPRLALAQKLLLERYGIPAARDLYWGPTNGWAQDPTAYIQSTGGTFSVYPVFTALRTWGDEISGLPYVGAVTFGGDWDKRLFGNLYGGSDGGMMALSTNGASSFVLPVTVRGNVSSLAARTWEGRDVTIPVRAGAATLPLDDMMLYVRVPAGVTITPNLPALGANLALAATVSTPEPTAGGLSSLHDGSDAGTTRPIGIPGIPTITTPTSQKDVEIDVNLGVSTTFNQVHVSCPFPFQGDGTLLDFVVQSWNGAGWDTVSSVTQTVCGVPAPDGAQGSRLDDYSERGFLFLLNFKAVTASKLRLMIRSASHGVSPTNAMAAYGNHFDTPATNQPPLREIAVYHAADPGGHPSYAAWQNNHFTAVQLADPAISGDLADPDGNGVVNLLEYALNRDPFSTDSAGLPVVGTVTQDRDMFVTLTYTQIKTAADLTYLVEVSGDLVNWSSGSEYTADLSVVDEGTTAQVTTRDLAAISPTTPCRFIRLRVSRG